MIGSSEELQSRNARGSCVQTVLALSPLSETYLPLADPNRPPGSSKGHLTRCQNTASPRPDQTAH